MTCEVNLPVLEDNMRWRITSFFALGISEDTLNLQIYKKTLFGKRWVRVGRRGIYPGIHGGYPEAVEFAARKIVEEVTAISECREEVIRQVNERAEQ